MGATLRTLPAPSALGDLALYECLDGDAVVACAGHTWDGPFALALTPSEAYPASLIARDLATLSHVAPLSAVVLRGELAADAAELMGALFSGEEVTMSNRAGHVHQAFCRPVPARSIQIVL